MVGVDDPFLLGWMANFQRCSWKFVRFRDPHANIDKIIDEFLDMCNWSWKISVSHGNIIPTIPAVTRKGRY